MNCKSTLRILNGFVKFNNLILFPYHQGVRSMCEELWGSYAQRGGYKRDHGLLQRAGQSKNETMILKATNLVAIRMTN